ncbi:centrosomal protein of 162 kDa-like [Littorina saxatilis]|uniref:centrosomal protein of 162 kDa-like n=1 Tax=Littorina saxatilis TaxID=31220 RepID=UPI0038B473B4
MARRSISKEDFDATFDAFLKTSVSSEDDTEKINQLLSNPMKAKPKNQGLWWLEDDEKKKGTSGSGKSFMKSKKVSGDSSGKVKASDAPGSSRSPRGKISKQSLMKKGKVDRGKGKGGKEGSPGKNKGSRGRGPSDASMSKDSLEDISEKSEEHEHHGLRNNHFAPLPTSSIETTQESVTTDGAGSLVDSDRTPSRPGFDTLDELAEKQRFFQDLEQKAHGSLDYSQLNKELSATGTGMGTDVGMMPGISADSQEDDLDPVYHTADGDISVDKETSSHQKPSMLSKVSLADSMDSTLNTTTSPQVAGRDSTGSRDTTQDNLGQTLQETLKTQGTAGAMGTNTSREMEELHQALREAGMSHTLGGPESRNMSGKERTGDSGALSRKHTDRSVGQLLKEMDEIEKRQQAIVAEDKDVRLMSDYKSPRSPRSPGLQRQGHIDDHERGFDNSHTEDTEVYNPVTAVSMSEKSTKATKRKMEKSASTPNAKTMEERGRRGSRDRFGHVQSSGYGKRSPEVTPRKSHSHSPSLSPIRPAPRGRTANASFDSSRRKASPSPSPSPRRQKSADVRQTQVIHGGRSALNPATSQDEPIMSKYSRNAVSRTREDVLIEELKDLRLQLSEERQKSTRLLADRATHERETERKIESQRLDYEEQIFKLKQENFVVAARLKDLERQTGVKGSSSDVGSSSGGEAPSREQVARLEKECKEQEELLARFQSENKRLYEEIRSKEKAGKSTEEAMFKENQRLSAELNSVRSLLEQKETELRSKGIITSLAAQQQIAAGNPESVTDATRSAHLEADLRESKRQYDNAMRELKALQHSRSELEQHVDALVMEREMVKKQLNAAKQARPEELKEMERRYEEEVDRLKRKLKWYAENQELLDKSSRTIKAKEEEVQRLKLRIEELQTETGKRLEESKLRSKDKAADAKKIQDLQRQVKEMEQIIRRRHPNSLPSLMMAAATMPDPSQGGDNRSHTVEVLEKRVRKLESELEKKDGESATLLRGMEQKYNAVKFQFEERVADLESQLRLYKRQEPGDMKPYEHPHTHAIALERELDSTRERYKKQLNDLTTQVDKLTAELTKIKKQQDNGLRSEHMRWQQVEADLRAQVATLQAAVQEKDRDMHTVMATVDRMQKTPNGPSHSDKRRGKGKVGEENYSSTALNTFPEHSDKVYQPEAFADQHVASLVRENNQLKNRLEMLQLERDQQRVDLRRSLAETESIARRAREEYENQIEAMRTAHQKEMTRIKSEQAVYNSTSKLASLQSRCDSQEVMVQHLQRQLAQREAELEQTTALKKREAELKEQVDSLQEKLREARRSQAPEMRHYEALEDKIGRLTERHSKREEELESLLRSSQRMTSQDLVEEVAHWRNMVDTKNMEICKFREELDSILNVLRELQRQGIKLPYLVPS